MASELKKSTPRKSRDETEAIRVGVQLMKALAHPMRIQITAELNKPECVTSPSKFAEKYGLSLSKASYHFKELRKYGCIEIVDEQPVRGSTEHFHKATKRVLFHSDEWSGMPDVFKNGIAARALCDFLNASREAIEAGNFAARDDSQFSWATIRVDELGWVKVVNIVADALEAILKVEKESNPRIKAGAEAFNVTIGLGAFEAPSGYLRGSRPVSAR